MRKFLSFLFFMSITGGLLAAQIDPVLFKGYDAVFVLEDPAAHERVDTDPVRSVLRFPPCSTFKIYNALIGLEEGLLKGADDPWYVWDGVVRDFEGWNKDLTLREALRVSAVPAFQGLAREIGLERMQKYIDGIGYGTRDISAGVDTFWLPREGASPIMISAREQVELLKELLAGRLPFSTENVTVLRDIMRIEMTDRGTLYGKTGSAVGPDGRGILGWFVGFVETRGETRVFACNITGGKDPSGPVARVIVRDILVSLGLL